MIVQIRLHLAELEHNVLAFALDGMPLLLSQVGLEAEMTGHKHSQLTCDSTS
jgi:hypothetical protein